MVAIVGDYNGGVQFLNACNESSLFQKNNLKIDTIGSDLDNLENYQQALRDTKLEYNLENKKICILRKPTSQWIRIANELLQSNFDHKRIFFGSRAVNDDYQKQRSKRIPIKELKFLKNAEDEKQSDAARMIDLVEHQVDLMELTKAECALIQIKTTAQGTQTFDLPDNLKRQSGPEKARKDSYSALVLGNWMIKIYYDMLNVETENVQATFTPMFVA